MARKNNADENLEALVTNMGPARVITRRSNGTKKVTTINNLPSRTKQEFAKDCDVNQIVAKYRKTGSITHVRNSTNGVYADMTDAPGFLEATQTVAKARQAFEEIPAHIRNQFGHDPENLMRFLNDPKNHEEAIKMGLMTAKPKPALDKYGMLLEKVVENTTPIDSDPQPKPTKKNPHS